VTVIYEPGMIRVSLWHRVLAYRDVEIWSIDCNSKYVDWTSTSGDNFCEVWLLADERTLHTDPPRSAPRSSTGPTGRAGTSSRSPGGRYEIRVCLWRRPSNGSVRDRLRQARWALRRRLQVAITSVRARA
jgi:hypothetical protein